MFIGDKIREENANIGRILFENLDLIQSLYLEVLAAHLDEEETGEESHAILCVMVSGLLLDNKTRYQVPIEYDEEDEPLIDCVGEKLFYLLTLEKLFEKGKIKRRVVNGEPVYTNEQNKSDKKGNKNAKRIGIKKTTKRNTKSNKRS